MICLLAFSLCHAQRYLLGKSKEFIRKEQNTKKIPLLDNNISNYGQEFDSYSLSEDPKVVLVFFYDLNGICDGYRILMPRGSVINFISEELTDYTKVTNTDWVSKDFKYEARMKISEDGIATFFFLKLDYKPK